MLHVHVCTYIIFMKAETRYFNTILGIYERRLNFCDAVAVTPQFASVSMIFKYASVQKGDGFSLNRNECLPDVLLELKLSEPWELIQ